MSISKIWIIFRADLNMSSIDNENILGTKMNVFLSFYNISASSSENMVHSFDRLDLAYEFMSYSTKVEKLYFTYFYENESNHTLKKQTEWKEKPLSKICHTRRLVLPKSLDLKT